MPTCRIQLFCYCVLSDLSGWWHYSVHYWFSGYPDYDGGSQVTQFAAQMISPDNTMREVYKGQDLDCIVAGLLPGRPYLFQVRAFNRAGVSAFSAQDFRTVYKVLVLKMCKVISYLFWWQCLLPRLREFEENVRPFTPYLRFFVFLFFFFF